MNLNKKECRKYADPGWQMNLNDGLLHAEQIEYIIRTAVKNIGGQRVLVLYIYQREQAAAGDFTPLWVMFQSRHQFITLARKEDSSLYWRTAMFENLSRDYFFSSKCAFYTPNDEKHICSFCKDNTSSGISCLNNLQRGLRYKSMMERQHEKEKIIAERMKVVRALPRGLKNWVHREVMPGYIFYDYQKRAKQVEGYCTVCGKTVQISGVKYNQQGSCPSCKKKIVFKSRGRRGCTTDRCTFQVLQQISEQEIVIRIMKVYQRYRNEDVPKEDIYENARIFVRWNSPGKMTEEPYYWCYESGTLTPWKKGNRPVFYDWCENFEADTCGYLYHENLDEVLQDTPWQYSQLKAFYLNDPVPQSISVYLKQYLKYPMLEYIVKLHLYRLAEDIVYGSDPGLNTNGRNIKEVLGVDKSLVPLLQRIDPGSGQLKMIQQLLRQGIALNEELLCWCSEHEVTQAMNLTVPLQYMTAHKFMKYIDEQYEKFGRHRGRSSGNYWKMEDLLTDYRDYLCMSEALEYDLHNSFVLFPARIKEAHDKANDLTDMKQKEVYDSQIRKMFTELNERYQFTKGKFVIIPPLSVKEIVEEGQKLHHCVGNYVQRIAKRECVILFVRKMDDIKKPLCTLEIKGDEVVQARIRKNDPPTAEIQHFIDLWKREVLQAHAVPAAA